MTQRGLIFSIKNTHSFFFFFDAASWLWEAEPFLPAVPVTRSAIPAAVTVLITARGGPNQTISLCCLDRHLLVKWKYDESSKVIHHFPPRCSLLPLTSHLARLYVLLLPSIGCWISPHPLTPILFFTSGSTSSSSSPRLLSLTSATCLLFDLSPHFHLLIPFVCVHPLLPLLFQLTFPFISHFPPHLHPLSASPYLSPPPLLSPLISLIIFYILPPVLSLPSTYRSSTALMSGSAASSQ